MLKISTKVLIVVCAITISGGVALASASFSSSLFGGEIQEMKSTQIEELESSGYDCDINGSTITIDSLKGPTEYFIDSSTSPKTNTNPAVGQTIMGKYSGQTSITCEKTDKDGNTKTETVQLDTITLFGTSRS